MALVAYSQIVHGEEDGSRTVIEPGEEVTGFDEEALDALKEAGVVGEKQGASPDEMQELRDKVRALEEELASARDPKRAEDAQTAADRATEAPDEPDDEDDVDTGRDVPAPRV